MINKTNLFLIITIIFSLGIACTGNRSTNPSTLSAGIRPEPDLKEGVYRIADGDKLQQRLTPLQYRVTRENETEPPFLNLYWDNHEEGIYVDIASGEPLFSSLDKFDSGTGWPSFTRPLQDEHIVKITDTSLGMRRTEVRSRDGDSHLGHLFDDGPPPTNQRYCINSASLSFIPVEELEAAGYGQYLEIFAPRTGPEESSSGS